MFPTYISPNTAPHGHVATSTATGPPQQQHAQPQPQQTQTLQAANVAAPQQVAQSVAPHNPYQAYGIPNVDMSSFQNVDWSSMYGMGMYV